MLIFLYSIVHTGTIFTEHLLKSHPKIHFGTNLNGTIARPPLNPLLDALLEKKISAMQFEKLVKVASQYRGRELVLASMDDLSRIPTHNVPDWPYTVLGCHILPKGYQGKTWPRDLFETGFEFPTVTPLRDPVAALVSMLLGAGDDPPQGIGWQTMGPDEIPAYLLEAYSYLPTLAGYEGTYFLPLDQMLYWCNGEKRAFAQALFQSLTGDARLYSDTLAFIEQWPMINVTTPERYGSFENPIYRECLLEVKRNLRERRDPRGILQSVDDYVEELRGRDMVIDFLKEQRYFLRWF